MKTPGIHIAGIGVYLPEIMKAEDAVEAGLYSQEDYEWFGWTGAAVAGDISAPDMAVHAARQAIGRSGRPDDIDLHIHAHSWPQGPLGWSPHAYVLKHATNRDVPSFLTWQACAGLVGGVELAASYLLASPDRSGALLTGADNSGRPDFNRWEFGLQNGVIGDAASAVVLSRRGGFARLLSVNSGSTSELEQLYRGNEPIYSPTSAGGQRVDFRERLGAFEDDLDDTVAQVVSRQGELRAELALRSMAEAGIGPEDVTRVAHVFTGLESYLKTILDPMGVSADKGLLEYGRRFGHLTVNDQIVALHHLVESGTVGPGDHVLVVAHGGGTAITCAVVRIDERPAWAQNPRTVDTPSARPAATTPTAPGVARSVRLRPDQLDEDGGR
ncbi:ketoacyl-ACP synthase III family protein [Streptomyces sp. WMMC1477]|uniref:ketoacyl-ACP synthase III family protein n=1 Tax=Streptomyces sp. WMMC1477 TaxID=3015155 RepID=UPI0022B6F7B0|nr:ketoacyl-ACP synthase III family protein [Streptomyces sp. WMMC1477]MCZ7431127.1 ketoacyl-ACP synthase III family protein [Streptomyces sp. WMMC1477]